MTEEMTGTFSVYESLPSEYDNGSLYEGMTTTTFPFSMKASKSYSPPPSLYVVIEKKVSTEISGLFRVGTALPTGTQDDPIEVTLSLDSYTYQPESNMDEVYFKVDLWGTGDRLAVISGTGSDWPSLCMFGDEITVWPTSSSISGNKAKTGRGVVSCSASQYSSAYVKVDFSGSAEGKNIRLYLADAGSDCVNAIEATGGTNTFSRSGTLYYYYTPTLSNSSLNISSTTGVTFVADPLTCSGSLETYGDGNYVEASQCYPPVFMQFSRAESGDSFTLSEFETPEGVSNSSPFDVSADTTLYAADAMFPGSVWIRYTAPQTGYVTVTSNALAGQDLAYAPYSDWVYNYDYTMTPLSWKTTSTGEDHWASLYVRKGDCYMFRGPLGYGEDQDHYIHFENREEAPCDTWLQAFPMSYGQTVDFGTLDRSNPVWLKVESDGNDIELVCAKAATATVFYGDITDGSEAVETFTFSANDGCTSYTDTDDATVSGLKKTISATRKGTYYIRLDGNNVRARISMLSKETTAISEISDRRASNSNIYNLNGQRVSQNRNTLPAGIYVVGGKKVLVK